MSRCVIHVALLGSLWMAGFAHATYPVYADGDLAPLGAPDGLINSADYLIASRITLGLDPTVLELSHGDIYPAGAPDGVINIQDLLLLLQRLFAPSANHYVENLDLFVDGPAVLSATVNGNTATTTAAVGEYIGPGATVINDPDFTDPADASNTVWYFSSSGGVANAFLETADLSNDPILDSGFDLSGGGLGQLVFDIQVNSLSPGATLTVKIDSGYPDLGQVALTPSQYSVGSWRRVVIDFADLVANPDPGGTGLDLGNVVNAFVIEVTGGDADLYLDNIFISHACQVAGGCNATINTQPDITDTDGDGVGDSVDLCPGTPPGSTVDANGCVIPPQLLSATATASSSGPAGGPALAVDGNMLTRWESAHGIDPSWITLDLGTSYALTEVIIHWEAANAATYEIQGSMDNSNWTTLSIESGGVFGDRTDIVTVSGTYRYVRMLGITRTSVYGYSIWEMEIYGTTPVDTDDDGIDDSIDQCTGTPPGSTVASNGCPDTDNDGVNDGIDQCPGTPPGNTMAANGCTDTDGDGVDDGIDQCPGTPPAKPVDAVGCELVIPVNEVASINDILAGGSGSSQPGFTLYVFDNDLTAPGTSTCNGGCATTWPPLLAPDGVASGVMNLGTIVRADNTVQATHNGRPLYFYSGDTAAGDINGDGVGGIWHKVIYIQAFADLFDATTVLEPELQEDTGSALITRLADRARDRHAREAQFQLYDHYLSFYWEHRTAEIEIVDTIPYGGNTITFNVITEWPLHQLEAELRFFHLNAAIYADNGVMSAVPGLDVPGETRRHYTRSVSFNPLTGTALQAGDRMEFELSQFLTGTPNGRDNYYGTAILYIVGQGVVPWEAQGVAQNSSPMPLAGKLGGDTTLSYQYSNEPDNHFMQMPTNLSNINGQTFVLGRRVLHTDFGDGSHDEDPANADFTELANKLGTNYINRSCVDCHARNGRAIPPATGVPLDQYVFKVGDALGNPDPNIGAVLQPLFTSGSSEGSVSIGSWTTQPDGTVAPNFSFSGAAPASFSARIAPQLVGTGLLEAIPEAAIAALADPIDSNGDGISGRLQLVADAETGQNRIGRFGWKAGQPRVRHQVAAALNTDMGVMTSVLPVPDCGTSQSNCGPSGAEISDQRLDELTAYISLLGVSARRDLSDPIALQGEALFNSIGCTGCHVDTFQTSPYHPHAELRDQTIHPYTDLLLHDMGPGLASTLGEGNASGAEWRTAPLWNIGLTAGVSFGEGYLHDGRARDLHEAILWHGGEAAASQAAYVGLTQSEKNALIAFLKTL